ncbi:hypothetical protein HUK80_14130 [Flavobacterium sp. MAH-1]|uniref:Uncharacterized protein n=1 Tax=Flavobacterium agri TaxID=2743471 RepID=A0A7Y9C832_9FLAO|nr:hypothetical protein [Flavobacterium agri]NUY82039.1 hypothetical protein [Flavobacterium agri]NYA72063.1 hypothetical protein [Flavobacterium agri]
MDIFEKIEIRRKAGACWLYCYNDPVTGRFSAIDGPEAYENFFDAMHDLGVRYLYSFDIDGELLKNINALEGQIDIFVIEPHSTMVQHYECEIASAFGYKDTKWEFLVAKLVFN